MRWQWHWNQWENLVKLVITFMETNVDVMLVFFLFFFFITDLWPWLVIGDNNKEIFLILLLVSQRVTFTLSTPNQFGWDKWVILLRGQWTVGIHVNDIFKTKKNFFSVLIVKRVKKKVNWCELRMIAFVLHYFSQLKWIVIASGKILSDKT